MAYKEEKNGDIVINGFEKGIAPSPHKGIANIQNANISTEQGEVMCSYGRSQQSQVSISAGTFTQVSSSTVSVTGGTLLVGSWVTATQTAIGLTINTKYYVLSTSGNIFTLSTTFNGSTYNSLTSGTCTFTTVDMSIATASATETYTDTNKVIQYRYYILDKKGLVWVRDTGFSSSTAVWFLPDPATYSSNGNATGLAVLNGYLLMMEENLIYAKLTSILGTVNTGNFTSVFSNTTFSINTPTGSANSHFCLVDKSNTCWYCDGNIVGGIQPNSVSTAGNANIWSYGICTNPLNGSSSTLTISSMIGGNLPVVGQTMTFNFTTTQSTELALNVIYYVVSVTSTSFTVSATVGGGAITPNSGAGTIYFNSFNPLSASGATKYTYLSTFGATLTGLYLAAFETSQAIALSGTNLIVGCKSNQLYLWDKVNSVGSTGNVNMPENNAVFMLTVNNMVYVFAGNKGNIYVTNGSSVTGVLTVPDYCAGVPGSPSTYVEPYFTWGGAMFLRGRIYFSILDQTSTKAGNCGGIWSFVPTQSFYIQQDTGISLRLENMNSYATYSGYATVILSSQNQAALSPQYWSAWQSDFNTPTYGIDNTATTPITNAIIETDLINTGTILDKRTFRQILYKLSAPADANSGSLTMKYRLNATNAWVTCGTSNVDSTLPISGYFTVPFEKTQWLQLQITLVPSTSPTSTFIRLSEIIIR